MAFCSHYWTRISQTMCFTFIVFFRMSWFLLHLNAHSDAICSVLLQYRVKVPISRVPVPSLVFFFLLLQILTLSSNVAHSCRASCGEFTAQWIRVPLSHRKGFGEHPTPPSHTSSPGQIRYGNPTKTRFYPIISVVLLLYLGQQQPLSPLPFNQLSLYLRLRFCYTHTLLDLCSASP